MNTKLSTRELSLYWLEKIVIGLELCPFARKPYESGLVRLIETESIAESDQLLFFLDELEHLQQTPSSDLSTTLITFVKDENDFEDFNDFVGLCEDVMLESGLEEHFQLIAFHPGFIFEGKNSDHRANWIGRSPFPTLHIIRNAEIELALTAHSDLVSISDRNEEKLAKLSAQDFDKIFYYLEKV